MRVAELEKELRSLRHRFEDKSQGDVSSSASPGSIEVPNRATLNFQAPPSNSAEDDDLEDIEVNDSTADLLLRKYTMDLSTYMPFLPSLEGVSAKYLRTTRPVLFTAILAASSQSLYPPLGQALFHQVEKLYAKRILMESEKSLEIVQALLVTCLWYHPPDRFSNLKFTTYAHLAANMALDIRLGRKRSAEKHPDSHPDEKGSHLDSERSFVACYVICSM